MLLKYLQVLGNRTDMTEDSETSEWSFNFMNTYSIMYVARILILNHHLGTRSQVHASDSELGYNRLREKQTAQHLH